LIKEKLMPGKDGFLNLPNHVFSRWWSDKEAVMQPDQGLRRVSCDKCFHGILNNPRFKVFKQAKCAVTLARTVGRSEQGQQLFSQRFALGP
jgi:DNA-directed RNA polymerase subunit RPC12/RpoP